MTAYPYAEESQRIMRESGEVKWCSLEGSKICDFYKEKNVFVTGATGFLGKLVVEKLLRACPDVNCVYILVRPKKGENEHERVDKLYSDQIFGPLTKLYPKFQHKIRTIKGDVSLLDLGISEPNLTLIKEKVNVIFHIAATVRFDEKLNLATAINVRGTRDLLKIASQCKNLESFAHISTAYANCNQKEIDEAFYKPTMSADELIDFVEKTPEQVLIEQTPRLMAPWPNTYTFTKAIAEDAVRKYGEGLPVCMVRPAIVVATYREPLKSWIDNLYGATGILLGAGTGLLKTLHSDKNKAAEIVPGDYVANSIIAAAYKTAVEKNTKNIPIYNYVSSVENHQTWEDLMSNSEKWGIETPTVRCVWYYNFTMNKYYWVHLLYTLFLHLLPAVIMDLGMILSKQRPIMLKIYKKVIKFESVISHFAKNEWKFSNDNTQSLWNFISNVDQKLFPFSIKELDWEEFYKTQILGLRIYVLKDDISTIPVARKKWRRFYIADQICKFVFYFFVLYFFYTILRRLFQM